MVQERQPLEAQRFFLKFKVWRDTYLEGNLEGWKGRSSRPVAQSRRLLLFWCWRVLPTYHSYTNGIIFPFSVQSYFECIHTVACSGITFLQIPSKGSKMVKRICLHLLILVLHRSSSYFQWVSLENWYFRHWPGYCIVMWMKVAPDLNHATLWSSVD